MSILIKGMEMPTTCGNCPVHKLWAEDDEAQCMIKRELWTKYSKRNPDCPLIEIPDGHGRLIDADALMKEFEKAENTMAEHGQEYSFSFMSSSQEISTEWYVVEEMVDNSPTIIPADKDGET